MLFQRFFTRACLVLAFVVLGLEAAQLAQASWLYLRSPYSRDYGEGCVLGLTQLLADRGTYFLPIDQEPRTHGIYPPLFLVLLLPFHWALGPTLWAPRLLSIAFTVLSAGAAFLLARRHGVDRAPAWGVALLSLAPWFVQTWAPLARVDSLALLLSVAGLLAWERTRDAPGWRRFAAFPLFWLAFFAKQSALLAPAAVVVSWVVERQWRRLRTDLWALAVPPALLFGLLALATHGQALLHLGPYTAAADYDVGLMLRSIRAFVVLAGPVLGLALLAVASGRAPAVLVAWWGLGLASLATLAKDGAAQNYMIEPWVASLVLAGVGLQQLRSSAEAGVSSGWAPLLLASALVAGLAGQDLTRLPLPIRDPERAVDFAELDRRVRAAPGPVLSENLSVLVLNGKPVVAEPFALLLLSRRGLFDPAPLVAECQAQRFALVIHEHRLRELPGMAACLDSRYRLAASLGPYEVYEPAR